MNQRDDLSAMVGPSPAADAARAVQNPFKLTRRFATVGLAITVLVGAASSFLLSRSMVSNLLVEDGTVTMEFIQGMVEVQGAGSYFTGEHDAGRNVVGFFHQIAAMPRVLRANVYSRSRKVIWSSDPNLIGLAFDYNAALEKALGGQLHVAIESVGSKSEHMFLSPDESVVENYLPIRRGGEVVGVVEVYKDPHSLFHAIQDGTRLIWASGVGGGIFLYVVLLWVVRRADGIIQLQQSRLVDSETLVALGAMATAVAHGIRNPLASIRSSAELNLESDSVEVRTSSEDIVNEVDCLERWVRDLVAYAVPESGEPENVQISQVLGDSLDSFAKIFQKRRIQVVTLGVEGAPAVRGDAALLTQVFNCLLTNAMEAMPQGGLVRLSASAQGPGRMRISLSDTGTGVTPEALANVFVPRRSSKRTGLGVGLALARRIVEHFGGAIELVSSSTGGATVNVDLLIVR